MSPAGSPPGPGCCEQPLGSAWWGEGQAGCGEEELTPGIQRYSFDGVVISSDGVSSGCGHCKMW